MYNNTYNYYDIFMTFTKTKFDFNTCHILYVHNDDCKTAIGTGSG